MKLPAFHLLWFPALLMSQTVHEIPFASQGNVIELNVVTTSDIQEELIVEIVEAPEWLQVLDRSVISPLSTRTRGEPVRFIFDVDRHAPVQVMTPIVIGIRSQGNQQWEKTIAVSVSPPENIDLLQNYPNPFNPITTISYQLPQRSVVLIKIFNLLGEGIETLVNNEEVPAGYHSVQWDASSYSSGMYLYMLHVKMQTGKELMLRKRMTILK